MSFCEQQVVDSPLTDAGRKGNLMDVATSWSSYVVRWERSCDTQLATVGALSDVSGQTHPYVTSTHGSDLPPPPLPLLFLPEGCRSLLVPALGKDTITVGPYLRRRRCLISHSVEEVAR